ncbi:hypothetical protein D3C75_1039160 [compost metagenome]
MALWSELRPDHTALYARNVHTASEAQRALLPRCTDPQAAIVVVSPERSIPCRYVDR